MSEFFFCGLFLRYNNIYLSRNIAVELDLEAVCAESLYRLGYVYFSLVNFNSCLLE